MLVYREAQRAGKVSANPQRDIRHRKENNSQSLELRDPKIKNLHRLDPTEAPESRSRTE
jgi:hypothetical protein